MVTFLPSITDASEMTIGHG